MDNIELALFAYWPYETTLTSVICTAISTVLIGVGENACASRRAYANLLL